MEKLRWLMDVFAHETNRPPRPAKQSDRRDKSNTSCLTQTGPVPRTQSKVKSAKFNLSKYFKSLVQCRNNFGRLGGNQSTYVAANSHESHFYRRCERTFQLFRVYSEFTPRLMLGQFWASYSEDNCRIDVRRTLLFLFLGITRVSRVKQGSLKCINVVNVIATQLEINSKKI